MAVGLCGGLPSTREEASTRKTILLQPVAARRAEEGTEAGREEGAVGKQSRGQPRRAQEACS